MMYIHNSASLRGVCTSYITQLRFVMYDVILHTSASLRVCKKPYQLCTNVITLYYINYIYIIGIVEIGYHTITPPNRLHYSYVSMC